VYLSGCIRGRVLAGAAALVAAATVLALAAPAGAFTGYGPLGQLGSFKLPDIQSIAVDKAGDIYVYNPSEGGSIHKYDPAGAPVEFSAGVPVIEGVGGGGNGENELAVDNSTGPDQGDIYVANNSVVLIYGANGKLLPSELTGGEACGVAVDSSGRVDVGFYPETVRQYTPVTNPVTNANETASMGGLKQICNVAVDGEGNVYAATYTGGVNKYAPSQFGSSSASGTEVDAAGSTLAADSANNDVFINEGADIARYGPEGHRFPSFGALGNAHGVGVDSTTGDVYAANATSESEQVVDVFGPVPLPTLITEPASNVQGTSATLNAKIKPEKVKTKEIRFQYKTSAEVAYTKEVAAVPSEAEGEGEVAASAELTGLEPNRTYNFRVIAKTETGATSEGQEQTFATSLKPFVSATETASEVGRTRASLEGALNPENANTTYYFEYGETSAYGQSTPPVNGGEGLAEESTSPQPLSELRPGATYHFALVATNAAGTTVGPDRIFTTSPPTPPLVEIGAASNISQTGATIAAILDPRGLPTLYSFEIAGAPGSQFSPVMYASANGGPELETTTLVFLPPATTFRFRITATNHDGTVTSSEGTFTTASYPPAPAEAFPVVPNLSGLAAKETATKTPPSTTLTCKRGLVRRNGRCVKKSKPKKRHKKARRKK
jgi:hypothetical protein